MADCCQWGLSPLCTTVCGLPCSLEQGRDEICAYRRGSHGVFRSFFPHCTFPFLLNMVKQMWSGTPMVLKWFAIKTWGDEVGNHRSDLYHQSYFHSAPFLTAQGQPPSCDDHVWLKSKRCVWKQGQKALHWSCNLLVGELGWSLLTLFSLDSISLQVVGLAWEVTRGFSWPSSMAGSSCWTWPMSLQSQNSLWACRRWRLPLKSLMSLPRK